MKKIRIDPRNRTVRVTASKTAKSIISNKSDNKNALSSKILTICANDLNESKDLKIEKGKNEIVEICTSGSEDGAKTDSHSSGEPILTESTKKNAVIEEETNITNNSQTTCEALITTLHRSDERNVIKPKNSLKLENITCRPPSPNKTPFNRESLLYSKYPKQIAGIKVTKKFLLMSKGLNWKKNEDEKIKIKTNDQTPIKLKTDVEEINKGRAKVQKCIQAKQTEESSSPNNVLKSHSLNMEQSDEIYLKDEQTETTDGFIENIEIEDWEEREIQVSKSFQISKDECAIKNGPRYLNKYNTKSFIPKSQKSYSENDNKQTCNEQNIKNQFEHNIAKSNRNSPTNIGYHNSLYASSNENNRTENNSRVPVVVGANKALNVENKIPSNNAPKAFKGFRKTYRKLSRASDRPVKTTFRSKIPIYKGNVNEHNLHEQEAKSKGEINEFNMYKSKKPTLKIVDNFGRKQIDELIRPKVAEPPKRVSYMSPLVVDCHRRPTSLKSDDRINDFEDEETYSEPKQCRKLYRNERCKPSKLNVSFNKFIDDDEAPEVHNGAINSFVSYVVNGNEIQGSRFDGQKISTDTTNDLQEQKLFLGLSPRLQKPKIANWGLDNDDTNFEGRFEHDFRNIKMASLSPRDNFVKGMKVIKKLCPFDEEMDSMVKETRQHKKRKTIQYDFMKQSNLSTKEELRQEKRINSIRAKKESNKTLTNLIKKQDAELRNNLLKMLMEETEKKLKEVQLQSQAPETTPSVKRKSVLKNAWYVLREPRNEDYFCTDYTKPCMSKESDRSQKQIYSKNRETPTKKKSSKAISNNANGQTRKSNSLINTRVSNKKHTDKKDGLTNFSQKVKVYKSLFNRSPDERFSLSSPRSFTALSALPQAHTKISTKVSKPSETKRPFQSWLKNHNLEPLGIPNDFVDVLEKPFNPEETFEYARIRNSINHRAVEPQEKSYPNYDDDVYGADNYEQLDDGYNQGQQGWNAYDSYDNTQASAYYINNNNTQPQENIEYNSKEENLSFVNEDSKEVDGPSGPCHCIQKKYFEQFQEPQCTNFNPFYTTQGTNNTSNLSNHLVRMSRKPLNISLIPNQPTISTNFQNNCSMNTSNNYNPYSTMKKYYNIQSSPETLRSSSDESSNVTQCNNSSNNTFKITRHKRQPLKVTQIFMK